MRAERLRSIRKAWLATKKQQGFSLVEALLGVAVFGLLITGIMGAFIYGRESTVLAGHRTRAILLAEEGLEVIVNMRDQNFGLLHQKSGGLSLSGEHWVITGVDNKIGIFTRTIEVGVIDAFTRMVTSTVTWEQNSHRTGMIQLVRKFSNWLLKSMNKTSTTDFTSSYNNSTEVVDNAGGEIQNRPTGQWQSFSSTVAFDADGTGDVNDIAVHFASQLSVSVANVTTGDELNVFDISDVSLTNLSKLGGLDYGYNLKDVDIYDGYAYVTTENDSNELLVIRLSDVTQVNSYDLPSTANAEAIRVVSSTAYVGTDNSPSEEFYVLDVSDPEGTISELSAVEINGNVSGIDVVDGYAYLATNVSTDELTVIRLSDYSNVNNFSSGGNAMYDVVVKNQKAYLAGAQSVWSEVYVVDVSNPEGTLSSLGSADVNGNAYDIAVNEEGIFFVASDDDTGEIYSFEADTYTSMATLDISGTDNFYGVDAHGKHIYIGGAADSAEVAVYESGISALEDIYDDAMVSPWTLTANTASTNETADLMYYTGSNSLRVNYTDQNSYVRFNNSFDLTNSAELEFYINTVSPWAYAAYNQTAPNAGDTVTYTNSIYGSTYNRNLSVFTDLPIPDMAAFKAIAQSSSSYLNPASSLTLRENPNKTPPEISPYEGKLLFVEFQTPGDTLTLDFDSVAGTYNISIITNGNLELTDYNGVTLNPYNSGVPVLVSDNYNVIFSDADFLTLSGIVYAGGEVDSSTLRNQYRIYLNGLVMAGLLDTSFERFEITYDTDWHSSPPANFSPDYSGQDINISTSAGTTVAMSDYLTGGIDNDPDTWEQVLVPVDDLNATTISYIQFAAPDSQSTNHTGWFVDDIALTPDVALIFYSNLGAFTSAPIDSGNQYTTWSDILWQSSATSSTNYVNFQIRTAPDNGGAPGSWSKWSGPTNGEDYFTNFQGGQLTNEIHRDAVNDQWLQYRAFLYGVTTSTPILESVDLRYNN